MNPATPFHKILIANRGEIALRVMRTAQAMGYQTVAVYSTADAGAPHVAAADQAVCIGEPQPAHSYLNIEALLDAARRTGADAVHPGYGFLAENAGFARACREAGLVFIGPSPEAIEAMGHKAGAKQLMLEAGVPCIPGYQGEDQSAERLQKEADAIGYPVMIKATAGGGGRGMRLVPEAGAFAQLLKSAQSEAQNAFGDAQVILERAIMQPRHIEIQILADRHGNAIHLSERDCSVQRRHQKLIEEAPSPAVDEELRQRMGETAVAAVKSIRYEGAGTLEFLLDAQGGYYFMEMNTRLQVEHPVTEAITGLDLVELQLLVASGQELPLTQQDISYSGHAIEVRLCAEDARQGFMPQSGIMERWQPAPGLRVEHALDDGAQVPPFYDSMIAKLIAWGATRDEARRRLLQGLEETVALGVTTNQDFLARCLANEVFAQGGATTAFIEQHQSELQGDDTKETACALAIAALAMVYGQSQADQASGRYGGGALQTLSYGYPRRLLLEYEGERLAVTRQVKGRITTVTVGEHSFELEWLGNGSRGQRVNIAGVAESITFSYADLQLRLQWRGRSWTVSDKSYEATTRAGASASDGVVRASMNGRVVAVQVKEGEMVQAGQPLVTLEAMKMEHVHSAPVAGKVKAVVAGVGQQVAARSALVEIEAEAEALEPART